MQRDRPGVDPSSAKRANAGQARQRVRRRNLRVRGAVELHVHDMRIQIASIPHRRRQTEGHSGRRAAVARRWRTHHLQVRWCRRLNRDPHGRGAVVRRERTAHLRVHAGAVVVCPGSPRRGRPEPHVRGRPRIKRGNGHRTRSPNEKRVRRRDRWVRRAVEPQPRGPRSCIVRVRHTRPQVQEFEAHGVGVVIVHPRRSHHEALLNLQRRERRDLDGGRAVVRRVRLVRHLVHAGAVVVRPGARRRRQGDRLWAGPRSGKHTNVGRPHSLVGRRDPVIH